MMDRHHRKILNGNTMSMNYSFSFARLFSLYVQKGIFYQVNAKNI